ncbi:MAG: type VII secretion-associated protein [Mycobacterium sp.]
MEVGPAAIRGPCDVDDRLVSTALECIDDEIALLDEQPVAVDAVWREVFRSVLPDSAQTAVLVCPTWWPSPRIELVARAAAAASTNVTVLQRAQVLADGLPDTLTVAEVAAELVSVWRAGSVVAAESRIAEPEHVAKAVADSVGAPPGAVLVDTPAGVYGAVTLGADVAGRLRAKGITVSIAHQDRVLAAVARVTPKPSCPKPDSFAPRPVAVVAGALLSAALLCVGIAVRPESDGPPASEAPMTLLVEGRVAVKVPAQWAVQRITAGPGSARVQVTSPGGETAVHITQSQLPGPQAQAATAVTLRKAFDEQPPGVFVQFNPDDRQADRPAVTYREIREGHHIDWVVFVDDTVRIGVGCQSASAGERVLHFACHEAIRSAHAVF